MIAKDELLRQFRAYLEENPALPDAPPVDLFRLFTELAALKNEVRIESRQVKEALDRFRDLTGSLQTGMAALEEENRRLREEKGRAGREGPRTLLLELRDRLAASLEAAEGKGRGKLFKRLCRKEREVLMGWREGQAMLLRRLDQLLAGQGVTPVETLHRPLDPRTSRAVAVEQHKGVADGVVVAELRAGFLWEGQVLRPAEVTVNRTRGAES